MAKDSRHDRNRKLSRAAGAAYVAGEVGVAIAQQGRQARECADRGQRCAARPATQPHTTNTRDPHLPTHPPKSCSMLQRMSNCLTSTSNALACCTAWIQSAATLRAWVRCAAACCSVHGSRPGLPGCAGAPCPQLHPPVPPAHPGAAPSAPYPPQHLPPHHTTSTHHHAHTSTPTATHYPTPTRCPPAPPSARPSLCPLHTCWVCCCAGCG